jgi:RHS repeat-associated protein
MERLPNPATGFAGDRHWYQTDGLDSVVALTDESGDLASPFLYDEYGQLLAGTTELQVFAYTGQDYDIEIGLYHFYARYYDAATGVWLTQDKWRGKIIYPVTLMRYTYVGNCPTLYLDEYGFKVIKKGILEGDYEYSCNCGWIDWGHANPNMAEEVYQKVKDASTKKTREIKLLHSEFEIETYAGDNEFSLTMRSGPCLLGICPGNLTRNFRVDRNLDAEQQKQITLGIYKKLSEDFENFQGKGIYALVTDSSFSEEDLVSNLIGFYRAVEGYSKEHIRSLCRALGPNISEDILENYEFKKNENWEPRIVDILGFESESARCTFVGCYDGKFPNALKVIEEGQAKELWSQP